MRKDMRLKELISETIWRNVSVNLFFFPIHLYILIFTMGLGIGSSYVNARIMAMVYLPLILASIGAYLFIKERKVVNVYVYFGVQILILALYLFKLLEAHPVMTPFW